MRNTCANLAEITGCGLILVHVLLHIVFWSLIIFILWKVAVYVAGIV